jgi:transposase
MVLNELVHVCGSETVEGFKVLPLTVRKPRKAVKVKAKVKAGRPRVYNGTQRRIVAAALKRHGLTKGLVFLKKERNLKVSMTLAIAVAKEHKIVFERGRPKAA